MARSETSVRSRNTFLVPLAVFFVLASIYLLTYSGLFRSIDELTMYSIAESAVQGGPWPPSELLFTPYHSPIAGFELLQPIFAALIPWMLGDRSSFWIRAFATFAGTVAALLWYVAGTARTTLRRVDLVATQDSLKNAQAPSPLGPSQGSQQQSSGAERQASVGSEG